MLGAGQRLYEERIRKGLTLEEVSKSTRIRISFLSAIEKGEYQKLPEKTYVQGFVRNYAEFLGLPKKEISALFRREFSEDIFFKVLPEGMVKKEEFSINRIRFQQTVITASLVLLLLLSYIIFQYRYALINPPLQIDSPKENSVISSQSVVITGKTDPNVTLFVNNVSVSLDQNGNFKKNVDLFPGKSTVVVKAVNRFGKQTEIERHVEVKSE